MKHLRPRPLPSWERWGDRGNFDAARRGDWPPVTTTDGGRDRRRANVGSSPLPGEPGRDLTSDRWLRMLRRHLEAVMAGSTWQPDPFAAVVQGGTHCADRPGAPIV